jgi:hypothetical protein
MNEFKRACGEQDTFIFASEQPGGFRHENGSQSLATVQRTMTHGREQAWWTGNLLIKHVIAQETFQNCLDTSRLCRQVLLQVKRHCVLQAFVAAIVRYMALSGN